MASPAEAQETTSAFDDLVQTRLPLSKIKKIAKVDPNVHMITAESIKLMAKGTEAFVSLLAKAAFTQAVLDKRKTIHTKDINTVIKQSAVFQMLQGALEDWPEAEKVERSKTPREGEEGDTAEEAVLDGETEEPEEDTEDETVLDNEMEAEEEGDNAEEDEDEDKENELVISNDDAEMSDTVAPKESMQDSLPDTVPLNEESEMDHD